MMILKEQTLFDELISYFSEFDKNSDIKHLIFQNENKLSNCYKILLLNKLYLQSKIRFLYLDIDVLNKFYHSIEKREYLSYFVARIFNAYILDKNTLQNFVNENLKSIKASNFIEKLINRVINENNNLIKSHKQY